MALVLFSTIRGVGFSPVALPSWVLLARYFVPAFLRRIVICNHEQTKKKFGRYGVERCFWTKNIFCCFSGSRTLLFLVVQLTWRVA